MALLIVAGFGLGFYYASVFQLPSWLFDLKHIAPQLKEQLQAFTLFTPEGVGLILFQNVRAVLIAVVLGIFSFGVVAAIILMIPLTLAGYFAGQVALAGSNPLLFLGAFILPHGIAEIPAIILVGGATLFLGASLISPPPGKSVVDGWLMALADWCKIFLGLVLPLLIVAACLEALVTPQVVLMVLGS
jgi:stage II sporulation protein M